LSHHDLIELTYGPVTPILSKALRSMFVAGRGRRLYGADFSNIEGRLNAWFAGEVWKLEAFRDYDNGTGPELYRLAYAKSFGIHPDQVDGGKSKGPQRKIGKTEELALGYQGSCGAWLRFDPQPTLVTKVMTEQFYGTKAWEKAAVQHDRARYHMGLDPNSWISIKIVVNSWREANSRIVQSWWAVQDAALEAVQAPGSVVSVLDGKVQYLVDDGFLWCRLPSGKLLAYAQPRLVEMKEEFLVDGEGEVFPIEEFLPDELEAKIAAGAKIETGRTRTQVCFNGKSKTGHWGRQYLYGGLQCNNYTQATARELLRFALHNLEDAGYPTVLHVHDEAVSEVDESYGSVEEYRKIMTLLPPWLTDFPLAAQAWTHHRYVK